MPFYKNGLFVFVSVTLVTCEDKAGVNFLIVNKSDSTIDSLTIEPNVNTQYQRIENGRQATYITNMEGIAKVDGSYQLRFKRGTRNVQHNFGYYTNGYPLEKFTTITLQPDTILINRAY